jgi:formylglycine-generating enzyme required for sulfatase activity
MYTWPVERKEPNAWGLYDMIGNVQEWCQDWFASYPAGDAVDPEGPSSGCRNSRILRGGSWGYIASACRSATRGDQPPDYRESIVGFRLAMSAE